MISMTVTLMLCRRKLEAVFAGTQQRDSIDLSASINYPNVTLSCQALDFGNVLHDTKVSRTVTIANTSQVPVSYTWQLPPVDPGAESRSASPSESRSRGARSPSPAAKPRQPFQIAPVNGELAPGESNTARVSFFAREGMACDVAARALVRGGPAAPLQLKASPESMSFTLEPQALQCGACLYTEAVTKQLTLSNTSKCAAGVVLPITKSLCWQLPKHPIQHVVTSHECYMLRRCCCS